MAELKNEPAGSRHRWWRRRRSREAEHENEQPELAESRRDYQDLVERFEATVEGPAAAAEAASQPVGRLSTVGADGLERQKRFRCSAPQAIAHLNELNISGDLGTFVAAITDWARDALSFDLSGRQFLKQIRSDQRSRGHRPTAGRGATPASRQRGGSPQDQRLGRRGEADPLGAQPHARPLSFPGLLLLGVARSDELAHLLAERHEAHRGPHQREAAAQIGAGRPLSAVPAGDPRVRRRCGAVRAGRSLVGKKQSRHLVVSTTAGITGMR